MTATTKTEKREAIERLQDWVKPGDTIYCIGRHRAASGMSRTIQLVTITPAGDAAPRIGWIGYNAARALGLKYDDTREGITVGGTGMDMGFHLVYRLAAALYPDGFGCVGDGCPSNDHMNGDRDYTPGHHHDDGGYALRHQWL